MTKESNLNSSRSYEAFTFSPEPSYKHTTYFQAYDVLLGKYCGQEVTIVEIGILNGGSLFMWREFFGPQARIIGIDLNPEAKKWEEFGFEIFTGSQQDPVFWNEFCQQVGKVDIVIDDGGHTYPQQIITSECVLDNINDGGVLIVEDTHTSYMNGFGDKKMSFLNYVIQFIHKINSRFIKFDKLQKDQRVFSIQIFESIVAFNVNREKSSLKSEPIWNREPEHEPAKDFRFDDKSSSKSRKNAETILKNAFMLYPK